MKIRWHGMLGTNHSWAFVSQALARAQADMGHEVFMKSTNSLKHFPEDLKRHLLVGHHCHPKEQNASSNATYLDEHGNIRKEKFPHQGGPPDPQDINRPYDLEMAYTIFPQAARRFFRETPCKMVIWNFESSILIPGWHLYHHALDYFLPSSQFSADIFINNGVPKEKCPVVPHGVCLESFNPEIPPFKLKTDKKFKFLHCAIPHHRKLHERVLAAYLDAFTGDDDVCLVMKTKIKEPSAEKPFEVNVGKILNKAMKGRKNPPEIEIVQTFVPNIGSLYTACDAMVSMSSTEGFHLPSLESMACGLAVIAPRYGGQLEFLNDDNAMLVDSGEMLAPESMQYWHYDKKAVVGDPNVCHCSELMRKLYEDPSAERARTANAREKTLKKFSWENAASQVMEIAEDAIARKKSTLSTPQKRSVMYVIPYSIAGGAEVWVRETIRRLDRSRYEPSIACPNGMSESLKKLFAEVDVPCLDLYKEGHGFALMALIESQKPNIVHFHNSLQVYNLLLKTLYDSAWSGRIVETVHSDLMWNDSMAKVASRKNVSLIIAVSNDMARKLAKRGNKNVAVLPQQVDWDRFRVPRSRNILGEAGKCFEFVFGTVARLSPEKNIPLALECARKTPDALFVFVGGGTQEKVLRQMAESGKLENVMFTGRRSDVENFYAAFDALLITSRMEGMPLVALEAMSAGVPVVAPKIGAIPEIVSSGKNGIVVSKYDLPSFVYALRKIREMNWNDLSAKSKMLAERMEDMGKKVDINRLYDLMG